MYLAFLSDEELAVVQKLKELTEQHRAQLIVKDKELLEKNNELEKVNILVFKSTIYCIKITSFLLNRHENIVFFFFRFF